MRAAARTSRPCHSRGLLAALMTAALLLGVGACASQEGPRSENGSADPPRATPDAAAQLLEQRVAVRSAALDVVDALDGGTVSAVLGRAQWGRYDGCSGTIDGSATSVRYAFRGRVDVAPPLVRATQDLRGSILEQVEGDVRAAGYDVRRGTRSSSGVTLATSVGDLEIVLSEFPGVVSEADGGDDYLGLDIEGPCVEIDPDESDVWLRRDADPPVG